MSTLTIADVEQALDVCCDTVIRNEKYFSDLDGLAGDGDFGTSLATGFKVIKADLDQAHFLIGAAYPNSGLKIEAELSNPNFRVKKSVDDILNWVAEMDNNSANRMAARTAAQLVSQWRARQDRPETRRQLSLFERLEMEQ